MNHAARTRRTRAERIAGVACALAVVALFSCFTLISRVGFATSLKLMDIAAVRFGVAGGIMLPVLVRYGLAAVRWRDAAALAFTGGLGFAMLAYTGFLLAPASHGAVLLHGTLALWTCVLAWLTSQQSIGRLRLSGLAAIAAGIAAMAFDSISAGTMTQILGDGALLLASLSWSAYGLLSRRVGLAPAHSASLVAVVSACCFIPVYLAMPGKAVMLASWNELLLQGVVQGVLIGALSIFVYSKAVALLGSAETALFTAAVPCVTTVAAAYLLGEMPGMAAMVGVAVVTAGMALAMSRR